MAITINGSTDSISESVAPVTAVPLTISVWFYPTQIGTAKVLFAVSDSDDSDKFQLTQEATGAISAVAQSSNTAVQATTAELAQLNTWNFAVGRFVTSTSRNVSINGAAFASNAQTRTPAGLSRARYGGRAGSNTPTFLGDMAEVGIWNVALTDAECASLAKGVSPVKIRPQSLVRALRLIRDIQDIKGNAISVTGTTVSPHTRIYP